MDHSQIIRTLEQAYMDVARMKDDHWTLDHVSRLNDDVESMCNFLDNIRFNIRFPIPSPRPAPRVPRGRPTVDHDGLIAVLDSVVGGLDWEEEWEVRDLQQVDAIVGDIMELSDDIYQRSGHLPPWC